MEDPSAPRVKTAPPTKSSPTSKTATVTTAATNKPQTATRSRSGCVECRRLRRKCDEARPSCLACVIADKQCSYVRPLRWRGPKSNKTIGASKLSSDEEGGIIIATPKDYRAVIPARPKSNSPEKTDENGEVQPVSGDEIQNVDEIVVVDWQDLDSCVQLPDQINWLSWLSGHHRYLIHHFINGVTQCISLHPTIHAEYCSALAPLALDKSHGVHLLTACLVAAARHRQSLGHRYENAYIDKLATLSISHLARQPIGKNIEVNQVAAATALVLCIAEIQAGGEKPGTWKIHLKGARAILATQEDQGFDSPTLRLLRRWCQSLDILSMSAGRPNTLPGLLNRVSTGYIDMFEGFSTSLIPIFQEMAEVGRDAVAINALQENASGPGATALGSLILTLKGRAARLDQQIGLQLAMKGEPYRLRDLALREVSGSFKDYEALNEIYHHAARLEIRLNLLMIPIEDPESMAIVQAGIACLRRMDVHWSTPSCKTLHSAFSIGCGAYYPADREFIISWMDRLNQTFAMGNVLHAKTILLEHWQRIDGGLPFVRPRALASMKGWELIFY